MFLARPITKFPRLGRDASPCLPSRPLLRRPSVDLVDRGLVGGLDQDFVDVDVRGTTGDPNQGFGNVFGSERFDAFVNLFCALGVPFEADNRKLSFSQT